ncbi:unnamed protein product [Durusdinium trenchii]|uniref:ABC1 atypical kinase-like domain-containing protein n=1 Tax=Durusdinium trenchii TaxID=1381693 RepID=A0ABP0L757_9DINO
MVLWRDSVRCVPKHQLRIPHVPRKVKELPPVSEERSESRTPNRTDSGALRTLPKDISESELLASTATATARQAWAQIRLKLAPEVRRSLCQLGPSYIKLGQALASRPDLVGGELAEELVQLQDSLPAFDTKDALEVIKQEFQGAQDPAAAQELLKSLEGAVPKAAASLGQVYQGVLRGRSVAVKVQRPEARRLAAVDAALLRSLARGVEALRNPLDGQRLVRANVLGAVDEFCSRLFEELDYRREASNCATFAALYGDHGNYASDLPPPGLKIPELEPDFCGRRVLVMEWVEGERLAPSADAKEDYAVKQAA